MSEAVIVPPPPPSEKSQIEDRIQQRKREKKDKFKSRWDTDKRGKHMGFNEPHEKTFTPMPFCYLPSDKSTKELEIAIRRHRLEDIQKRIAVGDFEINDPDLRSPSPEAAYDPSTGQHINSRDARAREKYTVEKNFIVEELLKLDNTFIAPADYKPPIKKRKIYLPDEDLQETNYIGLIIGPGGKTQKDLEKRSRCKIAIRGKGANIKSRIYNRKDNDQNEPLHILVESQNEEDLEVGVKLVEQLLDPNSDHKKNQLIEIAAIRGTLRDFWCEDCGERGHRRFECPNKINTWKKADLKCDICGQTTHPSRDCPMKRVGYQEGLSNEDDLEEFLRNYKETKANMIENGETDDGDGKKDNAFEGAAKTVITAIEKEAPGTVSKEVKDKMQIYKTDKPEEKLSDRVVATIDDNRKLALSGGANDPEDANPLEELHHKFKDNYGRILANQAVNFYNNVVQKRTAQPPPVYHAAPYQPQGHQQYPQGPPQTYYHGYSGQPPAQGYPYGYPPQGYYPPQPYPGYHHYPPPTGYSQGFSHAPPGYQHAPPPGYPYNQAPLSHSGQPLPPNRHPPPPTNHPSEPPNQE